MSEKVDISNFETGIEALANKMKFPPNFDGSEKSLEDKKAALIQFVGFAIMS